MRSGRCTVRDPGSRRSAGGPPLGPVYTPCVDAPRVRDTPPRAWPGRRPPRAPLRPASSRPSITSLHHVPPSRPSPSRPSPSRPLDVIDSESRSRRAPSPRRLDVISRLGIDSESRSLRGPPPPRLHAPHHPHAPRRHHAHRYHQVPLRLHVPRLRPVYTAIASLTSTTRPTVITSPASVISPSRPRLNHAASSLSHARCRHAPRHRRRHPPSIASCAWPGA